MKYLDSQEVLNALPTEYFVVDTKSRKILQTNRAGVVSGDSCYKAIFSNNKPCGLEEETCFCQRKANSPDNFDFMLESKTNGEKRYCKATGVNVKEGLVVLSHCDITEVMQQRDEIVDNTKRMEEVEKLANFGYWEIDCATKMVSPSLGSKIIYGLTRNVLSLNEISEYTLAEDRILFDESTEGLISKGISFNIKYRIKRPLDNAVRHIHTIAEFWEEKNKGYGIVLDITEAAEATEALLENKEYLNLLFDNMSNGFAQHKIITNEDGEPIDYVFLDVNQKFEELTGLKREDVLNKTVKQILPNAEKTWIERYGKVALTGEPVIFTDYSGDLDKYFEVAAFSPQREYFAVSFSDITNRKRAEKELLDAKEKAIESDRLKTLFLANMSHEIRTPLNGILGFSSLLSGGDVDEEQRYYYGKIIKNSGHRLMTVIDDIVNISMIQSNQLKVNYYEFDLVDLLEEIYVVYKKQNEEKLDQIDFKLVLPPGAKVILVYSDKDRIFQIIKNLLDNAFKFTTTGFIEFGVKRTGTSEIKLFVKDSGIGIAKSKQSVIFDTFRQVEEGQNRKYDGSGLGLAIVAGILEKLEGSIEVTSALNQGAEFLVSFPRNAHKLSNYTIEMITPKPGDYENGNESKTIVSFEDDRSSAEFLGTVVSMLGGKHVNFVSPAKGIEYIRNNKVDLILMDVQLPEMDGYEATQIIKNEFPEIPVIIQTAFVMAGDKEKAFLSGCDDYISKPIGVEALREKINKCLHMEY
uniref:PAS domain-containing hybrid sensor histidine kinase/response regulator n=1 Tax=uncultured Draconibacterium sp. TaxID=1573823 RepID=UPI003217BFCD